MKKIASIMTTVALASVAGLATYAFMNKDTKKNADKLLNTMMSDANSARSKMK